MQGRDRALQQGETSRCPRALRPDGQVGSWVFREQAQWEAGKRRQLALGRGRHRPPTLPGMDPAPSSQGGRGKVPGAERSKPANSAPSHRDLRLPAQDSGPNTLLASLWKQLRRNLPRTRGRATPPLTRGPTPPENSLQAGSSLTPSHPLPLPTCCLPKPPCRLAPDPWGWGGSALSAPQTRSQQRPVCGVGRKPQPWVVKGEDGGQSPREQGWNVKRAPQSQSQRRATLRRRFPGRLPHLERAPSPRQEGAPFLGLLGNQESCACPVQDLLGRGPQPKPW